jgi:hypothetical protein
MSLSWSTYSSLGVREFKIYRGESPDPREATYIGSASWPSTSYTDCTASLRTTSFWITAIDANGYESLFSNQATVATEPNRFFLSQNYPNPFNPSTIINFDLPEPSNVSLVVYDVLGRKVAELANGNYQAGYHSAIWNASDVASGVYFARFTAADASGNIKFSKVGKLLLTK